MSDGEIIQFGPYAARRIAQTYNTDWASKLRVAWKSLQSDTRTLLVPKFARPDRFSWPEESALARFSDASGDELVTLAAHGILGKEGRRDAVRALRDLGKSAVTGNVLDADQLVLLGRVGAAAIAYRFEVVSRESNMRETVEIFRPAATLTIAAVEAKINEVGLPVASAFFREQPNTDITNMEIMAQVLGTVPSLRD